MCTCEDSKREVQKTLVISCIDSLRLRVKALVS